MRKNTDTLTNTHYFVLFISLLTIALWCMEKSMEGLVGDMGIIAIIPLLAFFGTGILSKVSVQPSARITWLMVAGGFPFFPLVHRFPRYGRYCSRESNSLLGLA
jgi:di/tricarboxylate transporter